MAKNKKFEYLAYRHIRKQLKKLKKNLYLIRQTDNIEPIHQIRVASRRLREIFWVYSDCINTKKRKKWSIAAKNLRKGLGNARDLDVQIDFLTNHKKTLNQDKNDIKKSIEIIKSIFYEKRQNLEPQISQTLKEFDKSGFIKNIQTSTYKRLHKLRKFKNLPADKALFDCFNNKINIRLKKLLEKQKSLEYENAPNQHHKLRIAAKKLRYTMETAKNIYSPSLDEHITAIKKVQTLLGEIHDNDVWLDILDQLKKNNTNKNITYQDLKPGIDQLEDYFKNNRSRKFNELNNLWTQIHKNQMFDQLSNLIEAKPPDSSS